jgi:hypothetical protein
MIVKSNTNQLSSFLDHDNLVIDETKPIMKLNFQLTLYLMMKKI